MKTHVMWLCVLMVLGSTHGARILGIFPAPSISHQLPFQAVMKALAARGHQVTVMSPNPLKNPPINYTDIDMSFLYSSMASMLPELIALQDSSKYRTIELFAHFGSTISEEILESKILKEFIRSKPHFDLVFMEDIFNQALHGLIPRVGSPPMIGILSFGGISSVFDKMGNPNHPAYTPDLFTSYADHMTFWERLDNLVFYLYTRWYTTQYMMPEQERILRKYFGSESPSVWEIDGNFSLFMVNNHWSLSYPRPLVPAMIELGSLHLQEKTKPLPKKLKEFLDKAKDGFIYFSLGSNVRSDKLPAHKVQKILSAFSELPQRVLWKWESDTLPGQPSNVMLSKWLPQQDVLAHPNIVLFVTQGGLQSLGEATHHGVPLVGIPFLGDQRHNTKKILTAGIGLELDFSHLTKETLLNAMKTVINYPSYRHKMKQLSAVNRDQPQTPIERAVWWTEYVLRHKGARHLRSAALDLAWYQYLLLDVVAFLGAAAMAAIFVCYAVLRGIWRVLRRMTSAKSKSE